VTVTQQHRRWRPDVQERALAVERNFPGLECVTYVDHPWPGWDGRSFDVWENAETWTPASQEQLRRVRRFLMQANHGPLIRHWILGHVLWTSFGGRSRWSPDDHSGGMRHLHVTYW
jgi:hypothetical protein